MSGAKLFPAPNAPSRALGGNCEYLYSPIGSAGRLPYPCYVDQVVPQLHLLDSMEPMAQSLPAPPPGLMREPIPKTLYDLFAVHGVLAGRVPILRPLRLTAHNGKFDAGGVSLSAAADAHVAAHGRRRLTLRADWAINCYIKATAPNFNFAEPSGCSFWTHTLLTSLPNVAKLPSPQLQKTLGSPRAMAFINAAVAQELASPSGTTFYRAGYLLTDTQVSQYRAASISFGSTPLMGLCHDGINGCVVAPFYQLRALYSIDVTPGVSDLMHAPNLRRAQRIFSKGELLHPRSKSLCAASDSWSKPTRRLPGLYAEWHQFYLYDDLFLPPNSTSALRLARSQRLVPAHAPLFCLAMQALCLGAAYAATHDLRALPIVYFLAEAMMGPVFLDCVVLASSYIPRDPDGPEPFKSGPSWLPEVPHTA